MRDKINIPMAMPKMAPIRGPAEEFGEESSRRERLRGGAGRGIMSKEVYMDPTQYAVTDTEQ